MKPIYLSRIELQEFRGFSHLKVDLPATPGVLIVHGANGLGKSSLFDGLEWALTNRVDHFPEAKSTPASDYLRRWNARNDSPTQILLQFDDVGWMRRTLHGLDGGGVTDITAFLKAPSWTTGIDHLSRYLLLTHFLGQSTATRMTHRKPTERWEFLQGLAQSDRPIELAKALHGHGSSLPARAFERLETDLQKQASELERLLHDEEEQWRAAQLEGAIDERTASRQAQDLRTSLIGVLRDLGDERSSDAPIRLDSLIGDLLELLEAAQALLRTRDASLDRGRGLVADQQRITMEIGAADARLAALRQQAATGLPRQEQSQTCVLNTLAELNTALDHHRAAQNSLNTLIPLERGLDKLTSLRGLVESAEKLRNDIAAQLDLAAKDVAKAERRRTLARNLGSRLKELQIHTERLGRRMELISAVEVAQCEHQDALVQYERLSREHADLPTRLEAARKEHERAVADVSRVRSELDATKQVVDDLSAAVASIAAHLPADACECPVCATPFESALDLRVRVGSAADRLAPAVGALELRLGEAIRTRSVADTALAGLSRMLIELEALAARQTETAGNLEVAIERIGLESSTTAAEMTRLLEGIRAEIGRADIRRQHLAQWLQHPLLGGATGSLAIWSEAVQVRNELEATLEAREQEVARLRGDIAATELHIVDLASVAGLRLGIDKAGVEASRKERTELERTASAAVLAARNNHQAAEAEARSIEASAAELAARTNEVSAGLEALHDAAVQLEEEWQSLCLPKEGISSGALTMIARELPRQRSLLQAMDAHIRRVREGRVVWLRQETQRRTLDQLRVALDAESVSDRDALQRAARARQTYLLQRADAVSSAKRIASEANSEVARQVEVFNTKFLEPMNDLMKRLNRTILSDPDIGLDLKVGRSRVEQRAIATPGAPAHVSRLDPQFVHSEGQMAALAVSMLCAASLTFQWSRWPALIMDDPLQHNDVVHAAAFADLLCNLILAKGYQVFLSTHDLSEAEFLKRKFSAARIPCTTVRLLGRGNDGVETRVTDNYATAGFRDKVALGQSSA